MHLPMAHYEGYPHHFSLSNSDDKFQMWQHKSKLGSNEYTSLNKDFQEQPFVFQYPYLGFALFPVEQKVRRDFQETYLIVVQTNKPTCNACWKTIGNRFL